MKKLVVIVALEMIALLVLGLWWLRIRPKSARPPTAGLKLEAFMRDEDAPRVIQPSISVDVNDGMADEVFQGAPLWLAVGVSNTAAANEITAAAALFERIPRVRPDTAGIIDLMPTDTIVISSAAIPN